jgi:hypothetical protein
MTQLRTAWRRAVETIAADVDLAELLALFGPVGEDSQWTCDDLDAHGPLAIELRQEAVDGPIAGSRLTQLVTGITLTSDGTFEAIRFGEEWPWLAMRVIGPNQFAVATRSRRLLDELRQRFGFYENPPIRAATARFTASVPL